MPLITSSCYACMGSGSIVCDSCRGLGFQIVYAGIERKCSICSGVGKLTCDRCGGSGIQTFQTRSNYSSLTGTWVNPEMTVKINTYKGLYSGYARGKSFSRRLALLKEVSGFFVLKVNETIVIARLEDNGTVLVLGKEGRPALHFQRTRNTPDDPPRPFDY